MYRTRVIVGVSLKHSPAGLSGLVSRTPHFKAALTAARLLAMVNWPGLEEAR